MISRLKKVTPLEVAQRALEAIEKTISARPKLGAFVQVNSDEVIKVCKSHIIFIFVQIITHLILP